MGSKNKVIECTNTEWWCDEVDQYTEEEIKELCCEAKDVPPCAKKGVKYETFVRIDEEDLSDEVKDLFAQARRNPCLEVRWGDREGKPCGVKETHYEREGTCCDGVVPIYWSSNSWTKAVARDNNYGMSVYNGTPPFSWQASGPGLSITSGGDTARLHVDECFCELGKVTVTDACGEKIICIIYHASGTVTPNETQTPLDSPEGWWQDGVIHSPGYTLAIGKGDTNWSWQSWRGYGMNPEGETDEEKQIAICEAADEATYRQDGFALITPENKQGYQECQDQPDVWWRKVKGLKGFSTDYHAMYPSTDSIGTNDYDHPCLDDESLEYDHDASVETLAGSSSGLVYWNNGYAPFEINVSGKGFWLDPQHTITKVEDYTSNAIRVYTDAEACGSGRVDISDECTGSDGGSIRCTNGHWVFKSDNQQDTAYNVTCIKGDTQSLDDWCTAPISNCTDTGEDICEDPNKGGAPEPIRIEGNIIHKWECP